MAAKEKRGSTPLDQLMTRLRNEAPAPFGRWGTGAAFAGLAVVAVDVLGNLAGVPVVSGTAQAAIGWNAPGTAAILLILAVQTAIVWGALHALAQSPWPAWLEASKSTGLFGGPVRIAGVCRERSALLGLLLGLAFAAWLSVSVNGPPGWYDQYHDRVWHDPAWRWLWRAELGVLLFAVVLVITVPRTEARHVRLVHAGRPTVSAEVPTVLDLTQRFGQAVEVILDQDWTGKLVLVRKSPTEYEILNPSLPLAVSRYKHWVLDVPAAAELLASVKFSFHDGNKVFAISGTCLTAAAPSQLAAGSTLPAKAVDALFDLLASHPFGGKLIAMARDAITRASPSLEPITTTRDRLAAAMTKLDRISLVVGTDSKLAGSALRTGETDWDVFADRMAMKARLSSELNQVRKEFTADFESWESVRRYQVVLGTMIGDEFGRRVETEFGPSTGLPGVLNLKGHFVCAFAGGPVAECDGMPAKFNAAASKKQAEVEQQIELQMAQAQERIAANFKLASTHQTARLKILLGTFKHIAPALRRVQPELLESVFRFALGSTDDPKLALEKAVVKVQQLQSHNQIGK